MMMVNSLRDSFENMEQGQLGVKSAHHQCKTIINNKMNFIEVGKIP